MLKRVLQFMIALVVALAMMAIPASAATGGLSATVHETGGVSVPAEHHKCHKPAKHGPIYERAATKTQHRCKPRQTEPAKPITSEPFAVEGMEVFQIVDSVSKAPTPPTPYIVGSAEAFFPAKDKVTIRILAEYGSFQSEVNGGGNSKYGSSPYYYSKYILPPEGDMPANGYDTAWMVVMDRTKHVFVESEHVRFNILRPENVHHPVG